MRRPDLVDLGLLALAIGGALVDPRDPGEARFGKEFVFSAGLWLLLGLLLRHAATTAGAAMAERRRARALRRVDTSVAALEAVRLGESGSPASWTAASAELSKTSATTSRPSSGATMRNSPPAGSISDRARPRASCVGSSACCASRHRNGPPSRRTRAGRRA